MLHVMSALALALLTPRQGEASSIVLTRRAALAVTPALALAAATPSTRTASAATLPLAPDPVKAPASTPPYEPPAGSLRGQTMLITGANTGLGLESAKRLAAAGARVVVTARTQAKADGAVDRVRAYCAERNVEAPELIGLALDLSSLKSVSSLPERLRAAAGQGVHLEVLMNNAGVMAVPERAETADGFERTVGVNHLGHFALTAGLMPILRKAEGGFRIINVASDAHGFVNRKQVAAALEEKLDPPYTSGWSSYGLSKAANVLFTLELRKRIADAGLAGSAVSLHPGVVATDLARYITDGMSGEDTRRSETTPPPTGFGKKLKETLLDPVIIPVEKGASEQVWLAAAADAQGERLQKGRLYYGSTWEGKAFKEGESFESGDDEELAKKLWSLSEELTGVRFEGL